VHEKEGRRRSYNTLALTVLSEVHVYTHRTVWGTHWEEIGQRQEWEKWV